MKVYMKPVEMLAWFDNHGSPQPIRFKLDNKVFKVDHIRNVEDEKLAGNKMKVYQCHTEVDGELKPFELKFELQTCKWFLYKM